MSATNTQPASPTSINGGGAPVRVVAVEDEPITIPDKVESIISQTAIHQNDDHDNGGGAEDNTQHQINPMEIAKQVKNLVTELTQPRDKPFSSTQLTAILKFITFLWEGSSRNFRLMAIALLCNSSASYNDKFSTSSLFYKFFCEGEGISLWVRAFDFCTCELSVFNADLYGDVGTEMNALLLVVDKLISVIKLDARKSPQTRMLEAAEHDDSTSTSKTGTPVTQHPSSSSPATSPTVLPLQPQDLLAVPMLHRLRDFATGKAFIVPRSRSHSQGLVDEMRRTSINILSEVCVWAPRRNLESCSIIQALIDLFLVQEGTTYISHEQVASILAKCCFVGKLSPQDTTALFHPYVNVAIPTDHSSELAAASRRGKCELVLRFLASSFEGVAVFNCTAPLGLRLLIDALGLAGGSTKRKMLLMHIFVVMLHAAAPHRDVQTSGRWSSYAALDATVTKQFFGARSFVVNSKNNDTQNEEEKEKEEEQEEFDVIEDDDDDIAQKALKAETFETNVPVSVDAEPTTFFARDATLGAFLLILEREGLSRALISVLLPTVEELDPPLAEGSIALLQTLLNLMGNLLSFDVMIAINQALDNAIAHLLKKKNPIIGALIAKALPRPTTVMMGATGIAQQQQQASSAIAANSTSSVHHQGTSGSSSPRGGAPGGGTTTSGSNASAASPSSSGSPSANPNAGGNPNSSNNNNNPNANANSNANNGSSNNSNQLLLPGESGHPNSIAHASLAEKIEQARMLKSAKPLTEWNVFLILDIVQSPSLMSAIVAKERIPVRFVKHLLHFFRCDGLGDAKYFGEPFRSIPRENTVPVLGQISTALIEALVHQPEATNLADHEIPRTLSDFFVGCLMNPNSMEEMTKFMSGNYIKWVRSFTSTQHGLKLLAQCDFFNRIQKAATTNKAPEVFEMLVRSFSGKPGQNPDALGRCFLPDTDPRPQFYVDILKSTLAFDPAKTPSPVLIVANNRLRTAALSQLFVLAARARFTCRDVLFAATQVVFEIMTLSTVIGGSKSSSPSRRGGGASPSGALRGQQQQNDETQQQQQQEVKHDQNLLADCDLASQLLSIWIRMGGIDSDEWLAFESAAEGHLDKHVEKDYVQHVLHACYNQPGSTEGDTPIGTCLRKCAQKFVQFISSSPERLMQHVFGPVRKAFDESHFFNRSDPPIPGSRRYGSLRPQLLGAIAESEHGFNLLKDSSLFPSLVHAVHQVFRLVPADGGSSVSSELLSRLQRDASSLLTWAPASNYSWDTSKDPVATDFHHAALKNSTLTTLNDAGTGNSINRHQNIHVALLALGSICTSDSGAQLVGLETITEIISIASASLSNVAALSNFASTSMITLSFIAQSYGARSMINSSMGHVRCEPYDQSATTKNVQNAKVAFFSPSSISQLLAQKDMITSFQVGAGRSNNGMNASGVRVSPVQKNPSGGAFPNFQTESFASARHISNSASSYGGGGGGGGGGGRRSPFSASSQNLAKYSFHNQQQQPGGNNVIIPHELFMNSSAEAIQKEPFKSILGTLSSASKLKNVLEKMFKKSPELFTDLTNKRLARLMMAQPIALAPECRHLLALFFYMSRFKVKKWVESE